MVLLLVVALPLATAPSQQPQERTQHDQERAPVTLAEWQGAVSCGTSEVV
jgi:hypothetical protein